MTSFRRQILCVEDDRDTRDLLAVCLGNYQLTTATTFAEGLSKARHGLFDLYLLDNWLPDGSGIDLCREIRRIDHNAPIIFFSAASYQSDHEEAMRAGASAYIDKPSHPSHLEATVNHLIYEAESNNLDARIAEIEAVRSAITGNLLEIDSRLLDSVARIATANEHLLRAHAYSVFATAGATRAEFDRLWQSVLTEVGDDLATQQPELTKRTSGSHEDC